MSGFGGRLAAAVVMASVAGALASVASGEELARLGATDLHIEVGGVRSASGVVQYAVFDSPSHFPSRIGRVAKGETPATSPKTEIVVRGLRPGIYAVAVFHDENLNDEFDQGIFGIPLEDYGFSNNVMGFFSAPDFEDAKFAVSGQRTTISITIGR
jgi:uncharacterized protein (DUF2141 family)